MPDRTNFAQKNSANLRDISDDADIETSSDDYAKRFSGAIGSWLLEVQSKALLDLLGNFKCENLLDIGGGHGQIVRALKDFKEQIKITVLGSSASCSKQIETEISQGQIEFIVSSLISTPFENKKFDCSTSFRYLSHTEKWNLAINELCRVSRHAVIVDYPTLRSFNFLNFIFFPLKKKIEKNTRQFQIFKEDEIIKAFKENGFTLKKRIPQYFLPMVFHRKLSKPKISNILEKFFSLSGLTKIFGSPVIALFTRQSD